MLKMEKPNAVYYRVWDCCFSQPPKKEKLGSQLQNFGMFSKQMTDFFSEFQK